MRTSEDFRGWTVIHTYSRPHNTFKLRCQLRAPDLSAVKAEASTGRLPSLAAVHVRKLGALPVT